MNSANFHKNPSTCTRANNTNTEYGYYFDFPQNNQENLQCKAQQAYLPLELEHCDLYLK